MAPEPPIIRFAASPKRSTWPERGLEVVALKHEVRGCNR